MQIYSLLVYNDTPTNSKKQREYFMCLGIPMKILEIDQFMARCEAKGIERNVSLFMLQDTAATVGDYIVVQMGYATQIMSEDEALAAWKIYDEMLLLEDQERQSMSNRNQPNK